MVEPGATVCVLSTDPASEADFERFCEATGHALVAVERRDDVWLLVVQKAD